ncbi:hypothetical protein BDY21DRAFT_289753 [Lineolata rhizophorae]|uniref:ML-like domain-containing protein n=1 Tax=Lineolata rhizophorae TaxID=578093 RepID=A0A6A6NUB1_9PEZI|nr:hypothetical protein BDY21DRAFT_289753 [Lineolata rhizophorae]
MKIPRPSRRLVAPLVLLSALPVAHAADILKTDSFSSCAENSDFQVQQMDIEYNRNTNKVTFDVAGSNAREQNVTAQLTVFAYGIEVYSNSFNPCDSDTRVDDLCPVREGEFSAHGEQTIPDSYASQIPDIAFNIPDLDGEAKLELLPLDGDSDEPLACIQSTVGNGQTMSVPAVSYVAAAVAAAALALTGLTAVMGAGAHTGGASPSPTFGEVIGWFQSVAMNGMLSVEYPAVYRSFSQNFAFSGGIVAWDSMLSRIDDFRAATGGNLTEDSVAYLRNATLVHRGSTGGNDSSSLFGRSLGTALLYARDEFGASVNGEQVGEGDDGADSSESEGKQTHFVEGIQAYVEELMVPKSDVFMTVLLVFAIIIAAIAVGILLFKVILETWALFGTFPKRLTGFRKRYWWLLAKTITNLILLLYGVWTLYCVYQFTNGDSWAAKVLAGVTLAAFTAILAYFTFRIYKLANRFKKMEGDTSALFDDKETWHKYSLFYENYKKSYWWLFVPAIVYMFAKGCVIAAGDGHGLVQSGGQLIIEALLLILLLWSRPYSLKSGNWINIIIQVVRVLSVVCIIVFVEELGIDQSTKTITGVILIVMQSVLTGLLAILIAVNSIIVCCKANPHRKRRKEAEKLNRDLDNLTPLDARNSLLMDPTEYKGARASTASLNPPGAASRAGYDPVPPTDMAYPYGGPGAGHRRFGSRSGDGLLNDAASMGAASSRYEDRSGTPSGAGGRAPRLPDVELGGSGYRGIAY